MANSAEACAHEVLDVVPLVMRAIRAELRRHRTADLSLAQFRTLAYLNSHAEVSLSEVAEHIGLSLPTMSKLVDGLLGRGLLTREEDPADRRRVILCLTERARQSWAARLPPLSRIWLACWASCRQLNSPPWSRPWPRCARHSYMITASGRRRAPARKYLPSRIPLARPSEVFSHTCADRRRSPRRQWLQDSVYCVLLCYWGVEQWMNRK